MKDWGGGNGLSPAERVCDCLLWCIATIWSTLLFVGP